MGRLQGLLLAAGGEASNSSALAQWRLAVSAHLDDPDTVNVHSLAVPAGAGRQHHHACREHLLRHPRAHHQSGAASDGTTAASFTMIHQLTLNPGDTIKPRLRNNTGTVQFRFYSVNLTILGLE